MHDIRAIREDPAAFDAGLEKRGLGPQAAGLLQLDEARRGRVTEAQALQTRRNEASKEIGKALGSSHRTVELHRARLMRKYAAAIGSSSRSTPRSRCSLPMYG